MLSLRLSPRKGTAFLLTACKECQVKLTVPPLEIGEDEGFSEDKNIFKRRQFGERLANLIENTDGELVIALDAPWGEGKSTFIKMWQGYLKSKDKGPYHIF